MASAPGVAAGGTGPGAQEAVSALVAPGYSFADADDAVRAVLKVGEVGSTDELIRKALQIR